MNNKRDFKGVWIPSEIWLDKRLSAFDKVLLVEIDSLDNRDGCFKCNSSFADFMQSGVATVSRSIKKLKELGFIDTVMKPHKNGTSRVIKVVRAPQSKCVDPPNQNDSQGNTIEGIQEEGNKNTLKASAFPFESFWDLYDKKNGRPNSEKKYNKLSEATRQQIFNHVPRYKLEQPNKKYRKHPETYLNAEAWTDEVMVDALSAKQTSDAEFLADYEKRMGIS
tara:strand:- start:174 stop:839 length:666 start_codon:yes stop_codon:yes gene_type:complete